MQAERILAVTGTSEAVVDHRFRNAVRNLPNRPEVTVLDPKVVMREARKHGCTVIEAYDRLLAAEGGKEYDLVWCNLWQFEAAALLDWAKENHGAKIVVDQDDFIMQLPEKHPARGKEYHYRQEARNQILDLADVVVNSTPFLQEQNGGIVAPNFADPENWHTQQRRQTRYPVSIVCPISASRVLEWEDTMGEVFAQMLEDFPEVQWIFMGGWPVQADDARVGQVVRVDWCPNWLYKRMLTWVNPSVILSVLEDNDFNRARSNLKYLEAGTVGAAFVGTPVGEIARTVEHEETGLVTWDLDGALRQLAVDSQRRKQLADAARNDVITNWTWPAVKDQWMEVFRCRSQSPVGS